MKNTLYCRNLKILRKNSILFISIIIFFSTCKPEKSLNSEKAVPFSLSKVSLLESRFKENMMRDLAYLNYIDADRMLYSFRDNYSLSTKDADPLGGWESPESMIRGHSQGHVLTALSQAYLVTGEEKYKNKADYMVQAFKECQDAAIDVGYRKGYLSAFPETEIDKLFIDEVPWAPLYCIHKTHAGLIDCYLNLGNETALEVAKELGNWIYLRLKEHNREKLQLVWNRMDWNLGEYGGFNESLAKLFLITQDSNFLEAAKYFDHDFLFDPLLSGIDSLGGKTLEGRDGMHANTQIPKIIGAMQIFDATNDSDYYKLSSNFYDFVIEDHTYANGGNSLGERFLPPGHIGTALGDNTTETCNTYNMLKLTTQLFQHNPKSSYMDYYEKALYNHILGSQDPHAEHNHVTYFVPLETGGQKNYSNDYDSFWCCHGTGMENHVKYGSDIYYHTDSKLFVNLFIPSELNWEEKGFIIKQETDFPFENISTLSFIKSSGKIEIAIRKPYWLNGEMEVKVNDGIVEGRSENGYLIVGRNWKVGDKIEIHLPMALRIEYTPDVVDLGAIFFGPVLLAEIGDTLSGKLNLEDKKLGDILKYIEKSELVFMNNEREFRPFYNVSYEKYGVYFEIRAN